MTSVTRRAAIALASSGVAVIAMPGLIRAQTPSVLPVNIVNTSGNATVSVQELIQQQGYLKDVGLDATFVNVADGGKLMGALLSGSSDICVMSGFGQVMPAVEKGAKLRVVATSGVRVAQAIYSKRDNIRTIKDLEGKTVGTGSLGALLHQLMIAVLVKKGIDPAKITFANVGSSADVFRAVVAGTVDAGLGQLDVFDKQADYGVHSLTDGELWKEIPEFTYQGSFASLAAIQNKREALVRVLTAYLKAYRFISSPGSMDAFVEARVRALGGSDKQKAIEESKSQWKFAQSFQVYTKDLQLNEEQLAYMQNLNIITGVQKTMLTYNQVVDMSLAREAAARLA